MFKSNFLLLAVIVGITFTSCKKESLITSVTPSLVDALVKTKSQGNLLESYYYDNQKRLSKVIFTNTTNNDSYYYEYTYKSNEVLEFHSNEPIHGLEETSANGITKIYCTANPRSLQLDANGHFKGNTSTCEENLYKYDANGFIVEQSYAITDFTKNDALRNDKRNITKINSNGFSYVGGDYTTVVTFDYFLDKNNTIGNKNFGKNFMGKSSENLIKSSSENNLTTDYTYTFDNQNRVVNCIQTNNNNQVSTTYSYY